MIYSFMFPTLDARAHVCIELRDRESHRQCSGRDNDLHFHIPVQFLCQSQPKPDEILSVHIYVSDDPEPGRLLRTPEFDLQSQFKRKGQQNIQ